MPKFDHHRLDAFSVAREALVLGNAIACRIPRGYGTLADQLRRALLSAFLGIAEGSSRSGSDRLARFRCARGEASEAADARQRFSCFTWCLVQKWNADCSCSTASARG